MSAGPSDQDVPDRDYYPLNSPATNNYDAGRVFMIEVPARLAGVADVRSFIDSLDLTAQFSPERIFDMKVAASEAVANAIEHAKSDVRVWVWLMTDRLIIEVTNRGEFGPQSNERPHSRGRGYGFKLMVSLADEVTIKRAYRGSTNVRLCFRHPRHDVR